MEEPGIGCSSQQKRRRCARSHAGLSSLHEHESVHTERCNRAPSLFQGGFQEDLAVIFSALGR
ncbi:hypothetical protein EYF80_028540 [Liparis tanakae]|uniref:Uncharacterized protein n=1 Tax=Liparis tanakae TaxID=230148 RepID=A0A4Z2H7N8_9TELE|nr:hypothetical protein EYF80_028540 [Liparis tanakae]